MCGSAGGEVGAGTLGEAGSPAPSSSTGNFAGGGGGGGLSADPALALGIGNSNLGVSTAGELGVADAGMGSGSPGAPGPVGGPIMGLDPNLTQAQFESAIPLTGNEPITVMGLDPNLNEASFNEAMSKAEQESTINQALEAAKTQPQSKALETFFSYLGKSTQFLGSMVLGHTIVGLISDALSALGVSPESAAAAALSIGNGMNPSDVGASMGTGDFGGGPAGNVDSSGNVGASGGASGADTGTGGTGGSVANNDPLSYDFWNNFVDEWMGKNGKSAKTMYSEDDAFKKSKVEPAIGKYQAALADLTNQAQTGTGTFTPTTFGMGNFRSSFVPKSGHLTADKLKDYAKEGLTSELALTDVMQPNKGSMDYLTALQALAQFDKQAQLQKYGIDMGYNTAIDSIQEGQEDKGSWLDVIKDVVQIGDTVGDAWSKYF